MVPEVGPPLDGIHKMLGSVSSRQTQAITLDLNVEDTRDSSNREYLRRFRTLDTDLHRIASAYQGVGKTVVKLSANNPFVLGLYLRRFKQHGKLILGTRTRKPSGFGDVQWFGA